MPVDGAVASGEADASADLVVPCDAAKTIGRFSATGDMTAGRSWPSATLLQDGRVLVAGGASSNNQHSVASAELYDPTTGRFVATGPMNMSRIKHTATLLAGGKVLVAGGSTYSSGYEEYTSSAELFDPASSTFTRTSDLVQGRTEHTATLLLDGRVLIAGGGYGGVFKTAELYDPTTGTFSSAGLMVASRLGHTATLLLDGKVLIAGGMGSGDWGLSVAELYDPAAGTFRKIGTMAASRELHTATLLTDGKVLITGGTDPNAWSKYSSSGAPIPPAAELYDPTTETFAAVDGMHVFFNGAQGVRLPDGRVFIVYGSLLVDSSSPCPHTISGELYDPALGTFTYTSPMVNPRSQYFSATVLQDGKVLVAGGLDKHGSTSAELYEE